MESELKRILNCLLLSDKICEGEYYCIHSDHIHDLERALNYYFEEDNKIEKLRFTAYKDGNIAYSWSRSEEKLKDKINEVIDELNKLKEKYK